MDFISVWVNMSFKEGLNYKLLFRIVVVQKHWKVVDDKNSSAE